MEGQKGEGTRHLGLEEGEEGLTMGAGEPIFAL